MISIFLIGVALMLIVGFYAVITTRNLIRVMIGLEILTKAVTLLIIAAGSAAGQLALAQTLAITLIIIEVAVIVVAVGLVLCIYRHNQSVDTRQLRDLRG